MAERLSTGTIVGEAYRIVRLLGSGGMGEVYVAEQLATGRERALKLMHARLQDDDKLRERFVREARIASRLKSAHCVEVIGAGVEKDSGTPWLAMELLEGEDLGSVVRRGGALSPQRVLDLLEQICHAVGEAHAAGIVHRDLKPENIFIAEARAATGTSTVKVLDFGIAKSIEASQSLGTGAIGSPAWMAPEQAEAGERITPAADVWALGLLAFWMLTGSSFWKAAGHESSSMHAFLKEVLFEPVPSASDRASDLGCAERLPDGFDAWFERCVHREIRARFRDARELLAGLRPLVDPDAPVAEQPSMTEDLAGMDTAAFVESESLEARVEQTAELGPAAHELDEPAESQPPVQAATLATGKPSAAHRGSGRAVALAAVGVVVLVAAVAGVMFLGRLSAEEGSRQTPSAVTAEAPSAVTAEAPPPTASTATATATSSAAAAPPLPCGEVDCPSTGGGACCWDNYLSAGLPQGACVSGSLQADGCATTALGEMARGFETRIDCRNTSHCNPGEVCCGRLVEGGYKGQPYYEEIKCMPRYPPPRRQLCDDIADGGRCPRLPSGSGTIQAECKRSSLLPASYLVCGYPEVQR